MGKIRVKTFDEATETDDAKLKAKKEAKKAEKMAKKNVEKAQVAEEKEEEKVVAAPEESVETQQPEQPEQPQPAKQPKKAKKEKFIRTKTESKRHKENQTVVSKNQTYNPDQALEALKKFKKSKFDETVELHINVKEKGISGQVTLPHGTGKTLRILVADETIINDVSKGKINFDILIATPSMMPQLAKVARVLGPRGLMPNPKNGTITDKPEEAIKKLSAGLISYKTEAAAPIIHVAVGKISFEDNKLKDNMKALLSSIGVTNISSVTLKSTMSPAIKLNHTTLSK